MDSMSNDWMMFGVRFIAIGMMVAAVLLCRDSCGISEDD